MVNRDASDSSQRRRPFPGDVIGVLLLVVAALTFWCAKVLWSGERTLVAGDIYTLGYPMFQEGFALLR